MILVVSADDISIHATIGEASSEMEPPEVRNNEYTVYRSNGEKLGVCLVREGEAEHVVVIEPTTKTMAGDELRDHLVRFFEERRQPVAPSESLDQLVVRLVAYFGTPDQHRTAFRLFIVVVIAMFLLVGGAVVWAVLHFMEGVGG